MGSGGAATLAQTEYEHVLAHCFKTLWYIERWCRHIFQAEHFAAYLAVEMHMLICMMRVRAGMLAIGKPRHTIHIYHFVHKPGFFKIIQYPVQGYPVHCAEDRLQVRMRVCTMVTLKDFHNADA